MKKGILTFFACLMMVGLFAQKNTIQNYVDGEINKETFIQEMVSHFQQYDLTTEQETKVVRLATKKAENYAIISKMKTENPELYKSKMKGQRQHSIDSLRYILDQDQYRRFMMDIRTEMADRQQTKDKK